MPETKDKTYPVVSLPHPKTTELVRTCSRAINLGVLGRHVTQLREFIRYCWAKVKREKFWWCDVVTLGEGESEGYTQTSQHGEFRQKSSARAREIHSHIHTEKTQRQVTKQDRTN